MIFCFVLRVIPHPPNFAPVGAAAILAGRTLKPGLAMTLIALAMFVGDALLACWHGYPVISRATPFSYSAFFLQALLGRLWRGKNGGALSAAAIGAVVFFLL